MVRKILLLLILAGAILSCNNLPEYPSVPKIEFINAEYWSLFNQGLRDSITVTISFQDREGDLGLYSDEIYNDYAKAFYFKDTEGEYVTYGHRFRPGFESLPPYEDPYNCLNYKIEPKIGNVVVHDTVYFVRNENYYNFLIDFLIKDNDGTFKKFYWETFAGCTEGFDARFKPADLGLDNPAKSSPIEGELTYSMGSIGFPIVLRNKTFKFRIRIKDRAHHTSNVVESPEYTLQDIRVN